MLTDFSLLVWSKDRAPQLDLLLSSIDRFCVIEQFNISVLYQYSSIDFYNGYIRCAELHPTVNFIQETNFCEQTKELLNVCEYSAVSTDDTVVFRPFFLNRQHMQNVDIFSLRLGFNTIVQEPFSGRIQPALTSYTDEGETICWDSRNYSPTDNYGFKMGHDMVVYGPKYREIVQDLEFNKTNELETKLFYQQHKINPFIRSFKHSVAVNIPSNNQSGITLADNSLPLDITNSKFLEGKRFRFKEIEESVFVGCHQCLSLKLC